MSEDFNDNKTIQAQSSEAISGGGSGIATDADYVRPAEVADQDLYHGHSRRSGMLSEMLAFIRERQVYRLHTVIPSDMGD